MPSADLHTITLEILRPGPAHNQLLSPLTHYLALCDNRGAVTLTMPFEHREIMRQREALSYRVDREQREAQLMQTASDVGERVLGAISTLNAAMAHTRYGGNKLIHLRLILSASELSLLPFEMAIAPQGFPGEAKPLLLQSITPVTITREVRGATVDARSFSREPRILVITASPPGFEAVPLRAHMVALRRAIDAWVPAEDEGEVRRRISVLPRASVQSIREACAGNDYTHIHILAHGTKYKEAGEEQYGLALFDAAGKELDVVSGSRLIHALRTHKTDGGGFSSPNYVTLCTCDSGKTGSVMFPGANLAHELHEAGVPWVIASQFPLSMAGSVLLAELLYTGLLRGDDPRVVLHHVRQCLRAEFVDKHDWASLVTYAAVPDDFSVHVSRFRQNQSLHAIGAAFARTDDLLPRLNQAAKEKDTTVLGATQALIDTELKRIDAGLKLLRPGDHVYDHQGDVEKRRALVLHLARPDRPALWRDFAQRAKNSYLKAAKMELNKHRPLTHHVAMFAILGEPIPQDYWTVARIAAELDLESERRLKALETLIELRLLQLIFDQAAEQRPDYVSAESAAGHLVKLVQTGEVSLAGRRGFSLPDTRRKLERYRHWQTLTQHERFHRGLDAVLQVLSDPEANEEEALDPSGEGAQREDAIS